MSRNRVTVVRPAPATAARSIETDWAKIHVTVVPPTGYEMDDELAEAIQSGVARWLNNESVLIIPPGFQVELAYKG